MSKVIDLHADDFGISEHVSEVIIKLIKEGHLDSISMMVNMKAYPGNLNKLKKEIDLTKIKISLHLNFMEGKCLADPKLLPDLVDQNGYFNTSWGKLFLSNFYFGKKKRLIEELKIETKAQIDKIKNDLGPEYKLRIDSHQHPHMLPVVFEALKEALADEEIEYLRIADEPLGPFLKQPSLYKTYSFSNLLKNLILKFYSPKVRKYVKERNLPDNDLWGLMFSGNMDQKRVTILLPSMLEAANRKNRRLEILFHPGVVLPEEFNEDCTKEGFNEFHRSSGRVNEEEALEKFPKL